MRQRMRHFALDEPVFQMTTFYNICIFYFQKSFLGRVSKFSDQSLKMKKI